jgi:hypothetical protein
MHGLHYAPDPSFKTCPTLQDNFLDSYLTQQFQLQPDQPMPLSQEMAPIAPSPMPMPNGAPMMPQAMQGPGFGFQAHAGLPFGQVQPASPLPVEPANSAALYTNFA